MTVTVKITVFCGVKSCSLEECCQLYMELWFHAKDSNFHLYKMLLTDIFEKIYSGCTHHRLGYL
jgi:hypothetical protein